MLPLPQGRSRGPLRPRFERPGTGGATYSVWVGEGWDGYYVTREDAASIRAIRSDAEWDDWVSFNTPAGIHADMGDMGLDGELQEGAFVGTDGGIFKPDPVSNSLRMISAAAPGSGHGIRCRSPTSREPTSKMGAATSRQRFTSRRRTTTSGHPQMAAILGRKIIQTGVRATAWKFAAMRRRESRAAIAYFNVSGGKKFAEALLQNSRPVPDLDQNGHSLSAAMTALSAPFYLEGAGCPARWLRVRVPPADPPGEILISQNRMSARLAQALQPSVQVEGRDRAHQSRRRGGFRFRVRASGRYGRH